MRVAIVRDVPESIARCELTHMTREPIDVARAREQHRQFCDVLATLTDALVALPPLEEFPDSTFVEDPVVVLDEVAILCRSGAASRRGEAALLEPVVARFREILRLEEPALVDGGDVLCMGRTVYVGQASRSNADGVRQLADLLSPHGYTVKPAQTVGCLHLTTGCSRITPETVMVNPAWVDPATFAADGFDVVACDPAEPFAANSRLVGNTIVFPAEFERTRQRLEQRGLRLAAVPFGELAKAEAGPSCASLVFEI